MILPINNWLAVKSLPLIIAGPCSAESENQLMQTALALAKIPQVAAIRAGLWKPRTKPNAFEGVGGIGLKWLKQVKQETGLKVASEVATTQHIEACLKNEIDILWVGARTTVSPIAINEIVAALKGSCVPVLIKNPVHPDIDLWTGAVERFLKEGHTKIAAVHRGFFTYEKSIFRNKPYWEIPIELKRRFPDLPILTDPSHICGNTSMLAEISQKALDLGFEGLMIEAHYNPEIALSDSKQQLKPNALAKLTENLKVRLNPADFHDNEDKLEQLRSFIDETDEQLLMALSKRMQIVKSIGELKKQNNLTILQLKRWNNIITSRIEKGEMLGIEREFLLKLLELVHKESIRIQTDMMD